MITLRFFLIDKSSAAPHLVDVPCVPRVGEMIVLDGKEDSRLVMGALYRPDGYTMWVDLVVSNPEVK